MDDGKPREARAQQAAIDAETAATRREEAAETLRLLRALVSALACGDRVAADEAAVAFHRVHAMHERRAGRYETARAAAIRARTAQARLVADARRPAQSANRSVSSSRRP